MAAFHGALYKRLSILSKYFLNLLNTTDCNKNFAGFLKKGGKKVVIENVIENINILCLLHHKFFC